MAAARRSPAGRHARGARADRLGWCHPGSPARNRCLGATPRSALFLTGEALPAPRANEHLFAASRSMTVWEASFSCSRLRAATT